jgi:hypothetical protein
MKTFTLATIGLFLTAMATTAAAAVAAPCATAVCSVHGAPAPLIGGLPAALIIGGVWLGRRLLKRNRRTGTCCEIPSMHPEALQLGRVPGDGVRGR